MIKCGMKEKCLETNILFRFIFIPEIHCKIKHHVLLVLLFVCHFSQITEYFSAELEFLNFM